MTAATPQAPRGASSPALDTEAAVPLALLLEEAIALWRELITEGPARDGTPARGNQSELRRARVVRLLRASEACAEALGVAPAARPAPPEPIHLPLPQRERRLAEAGPFTVADPALTPREREVLCLVVDGRTDRDIADALMVSRRTATTHVQNILNKLGVTSRTAAAVEAVRRGLV